ncbi:putative casein kinase I isoform delta-like [Capsicum annuum]|uniref:Nucleolar protein 10 n=1 Tax=Capsicum annuum TaxID=4072 RepID=A0A2G3A4T4_CAPAN|nr:putative casein kinase I isoform delta-like [Capsicum annuum]KAF3650995.1 putative casein kinase I isoform delta-like [Capsicum annuum]PHT89228.1 hypothetical protein T459_04341 [Capsicum annuum]
MKKQNQRNSLCETLKKMYFQFYINKSSDKVYTIKKKSPVNLAIQFAHPIYFLSDDKILMRRMLLKKHFELLSIRKQDQKYSPFFMSIITFYS